MKFKIVFIAFIFLFLFGCESRNTDEEIDIFSKDLITFHEDDSQDSVTNDFTLVLEIENITISWVSSNTEVIEINNDNALVKRANKNQFVTLAASYNNGEEVKKKNFLIVVKANIVNHEEDTTPPVITGIANIEITIGSEIDLLSYVEATDNVDGTVPVTIKESDLDINKLGTYTVIYNAVDNSGNIGSFELTITVVAVEDKKTYVEDFSKLPLSGSTYTSSSFIGNNDLIWTMSGVRGDINLDGDALTFGGKIDDYSSIKTSLTGGISYFSVDLKKAFTSSNPRNVGLFINDDLVAEFSLDLDNLDVQVFEVVLDIFGDYTLEIAQIDTTTSRAQITLDNITIINNPKSSLSIEEQNLNKDYDLLQIQKMFIEVGKISIPTIGSFGSLISWNYLESSNQYNNLVNLSTGNVSMPTSGVVEIKLEATLKNGEHEKTKTFSILIGEGDPILISEAIESIDNQKVKIKGIVSSVFDTTSGKEAFIQDSSMGILVYIDTNSNLNVGDEVELIALKKTVNDIIYLDNVTKLNVLASKTISVIELTNQSLDTLNGKFVNLNGLLKFSYGSVNSFTLVNEYGEFDVYINEELINSSLLKSKISNKATGIEVDLFGVLYIHDGKLKVYITNPSDVEVETTVNLTRVDSVIHAHLDLPISGTNISNNLTLPTTSELFIDLRLEWTSSNQDVLNNYGVIYPSSIDVNVGLNYKIYIDNNLISSHDVNLKILKKSPYTGYYASIQGLSGDSLKIELNSIISKMRTISYTNTSYVLEEADLDLSTSNQLLLIYSRTNTINVWNGGSNWNKEHIWPQSKLGIASKSDIHNLRASNPGVNSSRGNLAYVDGSGSFKSLNGGWYPGDQDKGDVARIVLYMNLRWNLTISSSVIGDLQMFKRWHLEDPVDDFEIHRNQVIFENQENRNPFIDHPELVEKIYGSITLNTVYTTNDSTIYSLSFNTLNSNELLNRRIA